MCMFKTVKIIPELFTEEKTEKRLYIAENTSAKFEIRGKTKIYLWDGDTWIEECIQREQAYWQKKKARMARRADKQSQ